MRAFVQKSRQGTLSERKSTYIHNFRWQTAGLLFLKCPSQEWGLEKEYRYRFFWRSDHGLLGLQNLQVGSAIPWAEVPGSKEDKAR